MTDIERRYKKAIELLDLAEMHLGNLCLDGGLEDTCPEYEAWEKIQRFLAKLQGAKNG